MAALKCPQCGSFATFVIDSRPHVEPVPAVRRRRKCECEHRFSTYEVYVPEFQILEAIEKEERLEQ